MGVRVPPFACCFLATTYERVLRMSGPCLRCTVVNSVVSRSDFVSFKLGFLCRGAGGVLETSTSAKQQTFSDADKFSRLTLPTGRIREAKSGYLEEAKCEFLVHA